MKPGLCLFATYAILWTSEVFAANAMSLAGEWRFRMDPENKGLTDSWPGNGVSGDTVRLPGSMDENGKGVVNENRHIEYLSRLHTYVGAAWYERDVTIPPEWAGKRITLFLDRCHWESRVWVDGKYLGIEDSLSTPHVHDLSSMLTPGNHRITLCIDNRVKFYVGMNAHSITEHTQTNWNGVAGLVELRATDPVYIADVQVYPNAGDRTVKVRARVANTTKHDVKGTLEACSGSMGKISSKKDRVRHATPVAIAHDAASDIEFTVKLPDDTPLWDENATSLQMNNLTLTLHAEAGGAALKDEHELLYGVRDISRTGTQLTLNGRPYFVRGNLECCIFPLTARPPMTVEEWEKLLSTEKTYGVNHIRFHSWCPPEAAFAAADALGVTLQIETPVWTEMGTHADTDNYVRAESERILDAYGNHPSFCFLSAGNEPSGKNKDAFLTDLIGRWKAKDSRHLYTSCSGWPELDASDYHVLPERSHTPLRLHGNRILGPTTDFDYSDALDGCSAPAIAHELGQWCVYPRYDQIEKYTGVLRAWNLETFKAQLEKNGMAGRDKEFARASGRLQWLLYKADMEAVLRTPGMAGYQLLSVQDFPGQGTALVGFADALWNNEGAVSPEEFRTVNGETVPLLRFGKYAWKADETFRAKAQIAHFGHEPIRNPLVTWTMRGTRSGAIAEGEWKPAEIPIGNGLILGEIEASLSKAQAPEKVTVTLHVAEGDKPKGMNSWDIWVYPNNAPVAAPKGILITSKFDKKSERVLEQGGCVLLLPEYIAPAQKVPSSFESVFWNMQWFRGQRRQLGVLCDPKNPALASFPNDGHTDWQWWELLNGSCVINLDTFPRELEPVVRIIDDWNTNRPLGALFEARVGKGRLLVCSLDIANDLDSRPAASALRRSLLEYMVGDTFSPKVNIMLDALRQVFVP